jgi:phospholipid transport system substrate-binding protein
VKSVPVALALFGLLAVGGPASPAVASPQEEARAVVQDTVDQVLAILGDSALSNGQRLTMLEDLALERFDFVTMAKLVLKRDWKKFDEAQRKEFVEAFRTYLSGSYSTRLDRYQQEAVELLGERVEPRGDVTVRSVIRGGEGDGVEIAYRLRNRNGEWRMIDVVIEGISLISNFRSQFGEVISQGGPDELLRRLEAKNAENAAARKAGNEGA